MFLTLAMHACNRHKTDEQHKITTLPRIVHSLKVCWLTHDLTAPLTFQNQFRKVIKHCKHTNETYGFDKNAWKELFLMLMLTISKIDENTSR